MQTKTRVGFFLQKKLEILSFIGKFLIAKYGSMVLGGKH